MIATLAYFFRKDRVIDKHLFMMRIEPSTDGIGDPYYDNEESNVLSMNQFDPADTRKPNHLNLIHYDFHRLELMSMTVKSRCVIWQKRQSID